MFRPRLITVRAKTQEAVRAEAAQRAQALTESSACERLLVVYGADAARMYVEGALPGRPRARTIVREVR
jgi:hypothetical protein